MKIKNRYIYLISGLYVLSCIFFLIQGNRLSNIGEQQRLHDSLLYVALENIMDDTQALKAAVIPVKSVTLTAYSPMDERHNSDPQHTASMHSPKIGTVAVSRDLFQQGWVFGRKIYIEGLGIYTILDLMDDRWENRIDIVMASEKDARKFGIKTDVVAALLMI